MSHFTSLDEIRAKFGIVSTEKDDIRRELKKLIKPVHSDLKGSAADEKSEEKFREIIDAINFLDSESSNSLMIPMGDVGHLIKIVSDLAPRSAEDLETKAIEDKIDQSLSRYREKRRIPKISLAVITVVITAIAVFPGQLGQSPVLVSLIPKLGDFESEMLLRIFALFWIATLVYTAYYWMITYIREEKQKNRLHDLKLEGVQNEIFRVFVNSIPTEGERSFSKDELTDFILEYINGRDFHSEKKRNRTLRDSFILGGTVVDNGLAQTFTEKIIGRAERKGVITIQSNRMDLSDFYLIK